MQQIANGIFYLGVNDRKIDLFEGLYKVPEGMAYNSYLIVDEKIAIMDTVDANFGEEWLDNLEEALNGRKPDYIVVQHMECDHSANIYAAVKKYPDIKVVGNSKTFVMLEEYFGTGFPENRVTVADGDKLSLGKRELQVIFAPMVHWPEVMMTYVAVERLLFTADAFGKFGALDCTQPWVDEARRYYIGIVGKYGVQVTAILKKLAGYDVSVIAPLHGPIIKEDIATCLDYYTKWAGYIPEEEGVLIAYASVYGHTKAAAKELEKILSDKGVKVKIVDLARDDSAECVAQAFKYSKLVLASVTYNAQLFPPMREFIDKLVERNYQSRTVAFIENGSWAPVAAKLMKSKLEGCKNLTFVENAVKIRACVNQESRAELIKLADALV